MLFLTAIPDDYYFTWQLEIQLHNFNQLGIAKKDIHVLIGYDKKVGVRHYFSDLIENYKSYACFYTYPDNRVNRQYASSIRPHIIHQHVKSLPFMEQAIIFYYDTDVVLRELPDFDKMTKDQTWYVSDTRSYLDSQYIQRASNEILFNEMCRIVGVDSKFVKNNDINCGGAQYIIKNAPLSYWRKVEKDCEGLYELMQSYNNRQAEKEYIQNKKKRSECHNIQSWCADMWAVLWNAWLYGFEVRIHKELSFCWSMDSIESWYNNKILHYSGIISKENTQYFRKGNYAKYPPYYDEAILKIKPDNCSYPFARFIEKYRQMVDERRINLEDTSFLIPVRIDSESRLENLRYNIRYLNKHFKTKILIAESDKIQKVDTSLLPECCSYIFFEDNSPIFFRTKVINWLIKNATTSFIAIYDTDVIIPVPQILQAVEAMRSEEADMVYPYDGSFVSVDSLFKEMFGKLLDDNLLTQHINKFVISTKRSFGGAAFVHRQKYMDAGMENEYFTGWGPEDIERQKRMKRLGSKVIRTEGALFHLPHQRHTNSFYQSNEHRIQYMSEYLKICRMNKNKLTEYIRTWPWMVNQKQDAHDNNN